MNPEATVQIEKRDLVRLSVFLFPRLRINWMTLAVIVIGILVYLLVTKKPASIQGIGAAVVSSLLGGIIGLLTAFAVNLLVLVTTVDKKSGVLGSHRYVLTEAGLREVTDANDSLQKWSGIREIVCLPDYLYIRINDYLFHVLPRRAFANEEQFRAFAAKASELHKAA